MNILQINAAADSGGAGVAMARLHCALALQGHHSRIVARLRRSPQPDVLTIPEAIGARQSLVHRFLNNGRMQLDAWFSLPQIYGSTKQLLHTQLFEKTDVINLHNVHGFYFNYELLPEISSQKPVVWTLHDMWAITGHCAYSYNCARWQTGCFSCPLLRKEGRRLVEPRPTLLDRTALQWQKKRDLYKSSRLHIVTPSMWLANHVHKSTLGDALSIQCIPYGLDLEQYRSVEQGAARHTFGIPSQAKVILFVAANVRQKRKGLIFLLDALRQLQASQSIFLLTIGGKPLPAEQISGFRHKHLGHLSDASMLNLAYNAADVFATPALADNLPLVVMESLASGTPVVCFDVGGLPEMVRHMETGYLARYQNASDLATGIRMLLEDDTLRERLRHNARAFAVANYDLEDQVSRYVELYKHAIQIHQHRSVEEDR